MGKVQHDEPMKIWLVATKSLIAIGFAKDKSNVTQEELDHYRPQITPESSMIGLTLVKPDGKKDDFDSLDIVEVIMDIEEVLDVVLPQAETDELIAICERLEKGVGLSDEDKVAKKLVVTEEELQKLEERGEMKNLGDFCKFISFKLRQQSELVAE